MTEEKLKRSNEVNKLLTENIVILSDLEKSSREQICYALYTLVHADEKFKIAFYNIVNEAKSRLEKEFNEL